MDATRTAAAIAAGTLTAVQATTAALDQIAATDHEINAFTTVLAEQALATAAEVDAGRSTGPLAGVPVSIKDHIWLQGQPATNGSRSLADFIAPSDCVAVSRLRAAGAVIVGKTNNPEFCYRGITDNELYGVTRNPRDTSRTTGGSSGGAAASVAAGMVNLALGTDGGGSIRIPAAFCGVYGHKPTFGLVPKLPGFRGWPTLSVTGPIAASVQDLALALTVLAGPAAADDLSHPYPADYLAAVRDPSWQGLRIAVSADLGFADLDPDVRSCFARALETLAADGAALIEAHPTPSPPSPLWDAIALPEGFASEGPLLQSSPELIGADAAAIITDGSKFSAADYLDAQSRRGEYYATWAEFFGDYDVLLTPTMPVTAFETGQFRPATIDGLAVPDSFDAWCQLLLPANLAGLPATTIPMGTGNSGLPVGLQIMAARGGDATVLRVATAADRALGGGQW
jgi:Asp-tRNA(Asn)/Glu-tRNA(Gln) amidotransferase A subunit family amidase